MIMIMIVDNMSGKCNMVANHRKFLNSFFKHFQKRGKFQKNSQQDAPEFLEHITDYLQDRLTNISEIIQDDRFSADDFETFMCINTVDIRKCPLKHEQMTHSQEVLFSISVVDKTSVLECLQGHMCEEKIQDALFHCKTCQKETHLTRKLGIESIGEYLIIHLKRFIQKVSLL